MQNPTWSAVAALGLVALLFGPSVTAHPPEAFDGRYEMPSSFVLFDPVTPGKNIFGIGVALCMGTYLGDVEREVNAVFPNSVCIPYDGHEGDDFTVFATDDLYTQVSYTVAVDRNGDGCVSDSCNGVPNQGVDMRVNGCGVLLSEPLPTVDAGVDPILQIYMRVLQVDVTTSEICGGSSGTVSAII